MPTTLICQQMNLTKALPTLHLHLVPVPPLLRGVRGDLTLPGWWAVPTQVYGKVINLTPALPTLHLHLAQVPPLLRVVRACFQSFPQDYDPPQPPLKKGEPYSKSPERGIARSGDNGGSPSLKTRPRGDITLPINPAVLMPGWWAVQTQVYGKVMNCYDALPTLHISAAHPTSKSGSGSPLIKGG
ncbi:hypothetical protein [Moorena producens]|uniref:hypothetical protein n=1 Tax=Moorena producens TaxID=1155739 RepID=UPI003C76DF82